MNKQKKDDDPHNKLLKVEEDFSNMFAFLQEAGENKRDVTHVIEKTYSALKDATLSAMDSLNSKKDSKEGYRTSGSLGHQPLDPYDMPSRPASQTGKSSYTVRLSPLLTSLASSFVFIHSSS